MEIPKQYFIENIPNKIAKMWILKKHYAKRMCSISYAFGLFDKNNKLCGVCTYGYPPNYNYNEGKCIFNTLRVMTLELNRLVVDEGLGKNVLSYFVSKTLSLLPKPSCVVSYADPNNGHNGYIYQATNWIYTGQSTQKHRYYFEDGTTFDIRRGIDDKEKKHGKILRKELLKPTHRYLYFNGSKKEKKAMLNDLKMKRKTYPKGDNERYLIDETVEDFYTKKNTQLNMFDFMEEL